MFTFLGKTCVLNASELAKKSLNADVNGTLHGIRTWLFFASTKIPGITDIILARLRHKIMKINRN